MTKKWYNYFVSVDEANTADPSSSNARGVVASSKSAAQSAAEIAAAPQGYSILKVAQMLESEHIRNLPSDVKKSSVLVALDAAGADVKDVIQDAVRRDRALDTYERVQQRAVEELESRKSKENSQIQAEIDKYLTEQRAKMQANSDEVAREKERFAGWRLKKQQEEKKIADAVGYFVSENPITTGPVSAQPPVSKTAQRS